MPYGPGRFEGETPATFWLDLAYMDGMSDDIVTLEDVSEGSALFRGPLDVDRDAELEAYRHGWTTQEIDDARAVVSRMAGAVLSWNSQGFVTATTYDTDDALSVEWERELAEYPTEEDDADDDTD